MIHDKCLDRQMTWWTLGLSNYPKDSAKASWDFQNGMSCQIIRHDECVIKRTSMTSCNRPLSMFPNCCSTDEDSAQIVFWSRVATNSRAWRLPSGRAASTEIKQVNQPDSMRTSSEAYRQMELLKNILYSRSWLSWAPTWARSKWARTKDFWVNMLRLLKLLKKT